MSYTHVHYFVIEVNETELRREEMCAGGSVGHRCRCMLNSAGKQEHVQLVPHPSPVTTQRTVSLTHFSFVIQTWDTFNYSHCHAVYPLYLIGSKYRVTLSVSQASIFSFKKITEKQRPTLFAGLLNFM